MPVMESLTRSARDTVVRLGLADAAFRVYGMASRLKPSSIVLNARYRRRGAPDGLPLPPPHLIFLVAGTASISWFLRGGVLAAASIAEALGAQGVDIMEQRAILDFGCGCGRVLRNWHRLPHSRVCGTDYNPRLIEWCRDNLSFAEFEVNQLRPPLAYKDSEYDLIYALSVFTHLTEDLQSEWMAELSRVLKPGGHLIVSTHGEPYAHRLNDAERARFEAGELVAKNNVGAPGTNMCSAYHPEAYVRNRLAGGLEVVDFRPEGAKGNPRQDLYVMRRPARA